MDDLQITVSDGEREFLQYLHGYPGEPEWLSALLDGEQVPEEPEITELLQMLVNLRIHVRVLYEKQKSIANKLEVSELLAESRLERLSDKDKQIGEMTKWISDLKRQLELEKLRLNLRLKDIKHAAEKENVETQNEKERVVVGFENEKRALQRELCECRHEITQLQNRLDEAVQETVNVTDTFKSFYEDYLRLEEDLSNIERELMPMQKQFLQLADAMNVDPIELQDKLEEIKEALSKSKSHKNVKDVFDKVLLAADKDHTPQGGQVGSSSEGSSSSASFNKGQLRLNSSSKTKQKEPSCPFSQKFLLEELEHESRKEADENVTREKGRVKRSKLGLKIPKFHFSQWKTRI